MDVADELPFLIDTPSAQRSECSTCQRPATACLCATLPATRLSLQRCHCVVLQHPLEVRHKNRSLPLVELCLDEESLTVQQTRFLSPDLTTPLTGPNVWLVYPDPSAMSLTTALSHCTTDKVTLVFLDATWQFAREMYAASTVPRHVQLVQLAAEDYPSLSVPRRFCIRTPPSPHHLSTAECLAWVVSKVEQDASMYETIMRPLDAMVGHWQSFVDSTRQRPERDTKRKRRLRAQLQQISLD